MYGAYLWKGTLDGRYTARESWENVTTPKDEGGLGLKNLQIWNTTCSLKLLWLLLFRTESIWIAWIHQNVIKDESLWEIKEKQNHTWIFKQILVLREAMQNQVRVIPGHGRNIRFWLDPWTPFGPLIKFIGEQGPRLTGINIRASVASLWTRDSWRLPPARSPMMEQLLTYLTSVSLSDVEDKLEWTINGSLQTTFSSSLVYNMIRNPKAKVNWSPVVWIKRGIPKHKVLTWLFVLNRCTTRDMLLSWGLHTDNLCLLCNQDSESKDHLFFNWVWYLQGAGRTLLMLCFL